MQDSLERLSQFLTDLGPAAVAVSGGVDSMTLAVLAHRVNKLIQMYHAVSPAVPRQATERIERYSELEGWNLTVVDAGETSDPEYLANPANRCYFCKTNLYDTIVTRTDSLVLSGTNLDDLDDYRPGLVAAKEHQVRHPYVECEINKITLRQIAKQLGLDDLHDLPAAPCLSSRIETGIHISPNILPVINDIEVAVREKLPAVENVRCRLRQTGIVLELDNSDTLDPVTLKHLENLMRENFKTTEFAKFAEHPEIHPYHKGSAFLRKNLAVDVTPPFEKQSEI